MQNDKRKGSTLTTILTALMCFLILALFGKSLQATELNASSSQINTATITQGHTINEI